MSTVEDQLATFLDHQQKYGRQINSISFRATGSMWLGLQAIDGPFCTTRKAAHIINAVLNVAGVSRTNFLSHRRYRTYVEARQIAYWFLRHYTQLSTPQIGHLISDRDHSTILHGIRKVNTHPKLFGPRIRAVANILQVELPEGVPFG